MHAHKTHKSDEYNLNFFSTIITQNTKGKTENVLIIYQYQ